MTVCYRVLDGIEVEDSMLGPQFSDPNGVCGSARIDVCPLRGSLTVIFDGDRWSWKEWLIEMSANKERIYGQQRLLHVI